MIEDYDTTQMDELRVAETQRASRHFWHRVCLSMTLLSVPLLLLLLLGGYWIWDTRAGVVRDFRVVSQVPFDDDAGRPAYLVMGAMDKIRDCQMIGLSAVTDEGTVYSVLPRDAIFDMSSARPIGPQRWGPWLISVPEGSVVSLHGRYTCNGIWSFPVRLTNFVSGEVSAGS